MYQLVTVVESSHLLAVQSGPTPAVCLDNADTHNKHQ